MCAAWHKGGACRRSRSGAPSPAEMRIACPRMCGFCLAAWSSALARSSPCGHPQLQVPTACAGPKGEPSPPGRQREAAAALWCLPKVAHAAAFGLPGPGYNGRVPPVPAEARCRRDNHSAAVPKGHLAPLFERVLRDFPEFSPVALSTDPYVAQHGQSGGPWLTAAHSG